MAQCNVEMELENCLEEIERMQSKINELELQLHLQRMKDQSVCSMEDTDEIEDVPIENDNGLAGYEKVVASRKNPCGTTTQMFALKKTIPAPHIYQTEPEPSPCESQAQSVCPVAPISQTCPPAGGLAASNRLIYMKHSHETAVYKPQQQGTCPRISQQQATACPAKGPCPGAGPGCTCPPSGGSCNQRLNNSLTGNSFDYGSPHVPFSESLPPRPKPAYDDLPPCGLAGAKPSCGAGGVCGMKPSATCGKVCKTSGKVTKEERDENPFALLATMIECSESQPEKVQPPSEEKTEEEEKLDDVVNFINQEIFPILIEAVKGIIERVDNSDVCFCLGRSMESDNDFNEAIRKYRNVSKGINCFMQDILKLLSTKLAERSKKYSPQMELLLQGKGVVEQAEIALSEEIGKAIGREETVTCPKTN